MLGTCHNYKKAKLFFPLIVIYLNLFYSKLPFWSLWFGQFCHFSPNLKLFTSRSLWFHFCCHFSPKRKSAAISKKNLVFCPFLQRQFSHYK
ncbi:hypothetical protein Hanom_Chr14g01246791 [Helianthus anomalus]